MAIAGCRRRLVSGLLCGTMVIGAVQAQAQAPAPPQVPDLLSFAQGAIPVRVEADASAGVSTEAALRAIDGSPGLFALTRRSVSDAARIVLVYELPARTVFERFAVPDVLETPSPNQTFVRQVALWGSATSASDGFVKLASATLVAHRQRGQTTELSLHRSDPVRWVKLELSQGLDPASAGAPRWLEFSEIIGQGRQDPVPLAAGFGGGWQGRGVALTLQQQGSLVQGCYDKGEGRLQGTVDGRVLRATGTATRTGVPSAFIASLRDDGSLTLLQSTNGAPFYLFEGRTGSSGVGPCPVSSGPALGCGSVIHGIRFDFDSATIRPDSAPVLQALHEGLAQDRSARIGIEGHTSSEGDAAYNRKLSQRRAQAVLDELVRRGLAPQRLEARGVGAARPVAPNDDESGRSLNRRVEIHCGA